MTITARQLADLPISKTTGLQAALDAKAAAVHTHAIADVTALQAALDGKAATSHAHSAADVTTGTLAVARGGTGLAALGSPGTVPTVNAAGSALEYLPIASWRRNVAVDEFDSGATFFGTIGSLGWGPVGLGTGNTIAWIAGTTGHPGQVRLTSGSTSGNYYALLLNGNQGSSRAMDEVARWSAIVQIPTITSVTVDVGWGQSYVDADLGARSILFAFDPAVSAKWRTVSKASSGTETTTSTGADVVASNWYLLEVVRDPSTGSLAFYVNTALIATHTTHKPNDLGSAIFNVFTTTSAARTLSIDFFSMESTTYTQRWT